MKSRAVRGFAKLFCLIRDNFGSWWVDPDLTRKQERIGQSFQNSTILVGLLVLLGSASCLRALLLKVVSHYDMSSLCSVHVSGVFPRQNG